MNPFIIWLAGALFIGAVSQLEIVQHRREKGEPYYLPFFLNKLLSDGSEDLYSFWGDVWIAAIVVSKILLFIGLLF